MSMEHEADLRETMRGVRDALQRTASRLLLAQRPDFEQLDIVLCALREIDAAEEPERGVSTHDLLELAAFALRRTLDVLPEEARSTVREIEEGLRAAPHPRVA